MPLVKITRPNCSKFHTGCQLDLGHLLQFGNHAAFRMAIVIEENHVICLLVYCILDPNILRSGNSFVIP